MRNEPPPKSHAHGVPPHEHSQSIMELLRSHFNRGNEEDEDEEEEGEKGHLSQKTLLRDPSGLGLDRANGVVWKTGCPGKGSAEHWRDESDREGAGEGKAINRAIEDRRCGRDMKEAVNSWTLYYMVMYLRRE